MRIPKKDGKMKEKITKLFQCAMFLVDGTTQEELEKTFDKEEIRYCKGIITFWKNKKEAQEDE